MLFGDERRGSGVTASPGFLHNSEIMCPFFFVSIKSQVLCASVSLGIAAKQGYFLPQAEKALVSSLSRSKWHGGGRCHWRCGLVSTVESTLNGSVQKP